mgnify:CR=1 FL=1|nr:hypothetical cell surface receptor [uncultured bacterium]
MEIAPDESVTLTVVAAGTPPLFYQWMSGGIDLVGATLPYYVTGPLEETTSYQVRVTNIYGTVTSPAATVTVVSPVPPVFDGLVSYWSFDSGWNDQVGTNHLTNVNGVTAVPGKLGNAGDFESSSSQYLSHADPTPLGDEDFTYALWFKRESFSQDVALITKAAYWLAINVAGQIYWYWPTSGSVAQTGGDTGNTTNWIFAVAWHDAAANTLNLQINNGTVISGSTGGVTPLPLSGSVQIGHLVSPSQYFDGLIDEVGLWRRVLTAQERTDLYNGGAGLGYTP